jgi:hypothetical protein
MKRLYPTCFMVIVVCAYSTLAQSGNSDRCELALTDVKTGKSTELGTFTTVVAEEELTSRVFRPPRTKLYIVAGVFYTDESMESASGADSISLELSLSRGQKRDVLRSLRWVGAEMPLNGFDVGRVSLIVRVNGHPKMVLMECRKNVRR